MKDLWSPLLLLFSLKQIPRISEKVGEFSSIDCFLTHGFVQISNFQISKLDFHIHGRYVKE
jgi:hypothetical protein